MATGPRPATSMHSVRGPSLVRGSYLADVLLRTIVTLLGVISIFAVLTIELGRRARDETLELSPVVNDYAVAQTPYKTPHERIAAALPVDPALPVWQQYLEYVVGVLTRWPILLTVLLIGAGFIVVARTS